MGFATEQGDGPAGHASDPEEWFSNIKLIAEALSAQIRQIQQIQGSHPSGSSKILNIGRLLEKVDLDRSIQASFDNCKILALAVGYSRNELDVPPLCHYIALRYVIDFPALIMQVYVCK